MALCRPCRLYPGKRVSRVAFSRGFENVCILEQADPRALIPSYMGCLSGASMSAQSTGKTSSLSMIINVYHTYVLGDKSVPNEACQVYAACHLANHEDTLIRSVLSDSIPLSIFISASKKAATNSQHCLGVKSDKLKEIRGFNGIRSHSAPHVFLYLGSEPMS